MLSGYRNTPLEAHLHSVFRKLAASLGECATIDSMYLDDSVTYISEPLAEIDAEVFNTVFSAVRTNREISFDYRPLQKQTYMQRIVKPYHIVCQKEAGMSSAMTAIRAAYGFSPFPEYGTPLLQAKLLPFPMILTGTSILTRTSACGQALRYCTKSTFVSLPK